MLKREPCCVCDDDFRMLWGVETVTWITGGRQHIKSNQVSSLMLTEENITETKIQPHFKYPAICAGNLEEKLRGATEHFTVCRI